MREGDTLRIARLRKAVKMALSELYALDRHDLPPMARTTIDATTSHLHDALKRDDPREAL
jgi:hypothetical protein